LVKLKSAAGGMVITPILRSTTPSDATGIFDPAAHRRRM
jgi:hypothetical protein